MNIPAHNPKYADYAQTTIDLVIEHPDFGTLPFTASVNDIEPLGQTLYARALAGDFGDIAPYDGSPPSDPIDALAQQMRDERNQKLVALDAIVNNPLRWAEYSDAQKAAFAVYRQALLDVPQQPGFPHEIDWQQLDLPE